MSRHLLWLIAPLWLSWARLRALGAFSEPPLYGGTGSDFYAGASIARTSLDAVGAWAGLVPGFDFPVGMRPAELSEFFTEPLPRLLLGGLAALIGEPMSALRWGMILSTLANIWGTWAILWYRGGRERPLATVAAWAVICLSPWPWARTTVHWQLGWVPIFLGVLAIWWDFFVRGRAHRPWIVVGAHGLLLLQSVYYGVFAIFAVAFWSLASARALVTDRKRRRAWLGLAAGAAAGYALAVSWSVTGLGGLESFRKIREASVRPLTELHQYSSRMRELTRGGYESTWNRLAGLPPGRFAHDGESFPSPLPKLAWLAALVATALVWKRARRATAYFLVLFWGFALIGLQEIPWIREGVIYPLLPFIRSYARIMMPILCAGALWTAELGALFPSRLRPARAAALLAGWLALLWIDYGWPQAAQAMRPGLPCAEEYAVLAREKLPLLPVRATGATAGPSLCPGWREFDFYAAAGVPVIARPWHAPGGPIAPGTPDCARWRERIARIGSVALWLDGDEKDRRTTLSCLEPRKLTILHQTSSGSIVRLD